MINSLTTIFLKVLKSEHGVLQGLDGKPGWWTAQIIKTVQWFTSVEEVRDWSSLTPFLFPAEVSHLFPGPSEPN